MARSLLTNSDTDLLVFSTSGPSEVIHDDTLSGNATNSAPLGLASGVVNSIANKLDTTSFDPNAFYPMTGNPSGFMNGMFVAQYGITTYNEIKSAVDTNKIVYCQVSPGAPASRMAFLAYYGNNNFEFQYYRSLNSHTSANQGDEVYVYACNKTGTPWTTTVRRAYTQISVGSGLSGVFNSGISSKYNLTVTGFATTEDFSNTNSFLSGAIDYVSANAGGLTGVSTNSNITGDGKANSPIGLQNPFSFGANGVTATWSNTGMAVGNNSIKTVVNNSGLTFSGTSSFINSTDINIGGANKVSGGSVGFGSNNSAYDGATAMGNNLIASGKTLAIGTLNKTSSDASFVIGNGSYLGRKDLFLIDNSGVYYRGNELMNVSGLEGDTVHGYSGFSGTPWYVGKRSITFPLPGVAGLDIGKPGAPVYDYDGTWGNVTEITLTKSKRNTTSTTYITANGTDVYELHNGEWIRFFAANEENGDGLVWAHDATNFSGTWTR
jgi:hypothetical protein